MQIVDSPPAPPYTASHTQKLAWEAPVAPDNKDRRLAAILSADVVGYSRLIGVDEVGTLSALQAHQAELIDPEIAAHNGRIVKLMGDGLLVEFASAVNAVQCAVAIQRGLFTESMITGGAVPIWLP